MYVHLFSSSHTAISGLCDSASEKYISDTATAIAKNANTKIIQQINRKKNSNQKKILLSIYLGIKPHAAAGAGKCERNQIITCNKINSFHAI